ncbi:MAG: alanine--tRNA ligase-related protein, partial [bacterium]
RRKRRRGLVWVDVVATRTLETTLDAFIEMATGCGLARLPPQRLVVPYFHGEFNRCVEHRALNDLLDMPVEQGGSGWYQIGMACRISDTKKVEFGWHTTVFEMLTAIWRQEPVLVEHGQDELATAMVELLTRGLGLDLKRLRVTYFGGGEVIPGLTLEPDEAGRSAFARAGLPAISLVPVRGPKNFVLFIGGGERTGPKYEIQYLLSNNPGDRWIEVATAIVDCYQWERRPDAGKWSLRRPRSVLTGCALGVERLTAAQLDAGDVWVSPVLHDLLAAIREAATQDIATEEVLGGDRLILADLVRSTMFLLADGAGEDGRSAESRLLQSMLRRIRRKAALLCVSDWAGLVECLSALVVKHYHRRYPTIDAGKTRLLSTVSRVVWPEGWNPDSYTRDGE